MRTVIEALILFIGGMCVVVVGIGVALVAALWVVGILFRMVAP